jgi:hypothetical protein
MAVAGGASFGHYDWHPQEGRGEIEIRLGGTYVIATTPDVRAH